MCCTAIPAQLLFAVAHLVVLVLGLLFVARPHPSAGGTLAVGACIGILAGLGGPAVELVLWGVGAATAEAGIGVVLIAVAMVFGMVAPAMSLAAMLMYAVAAVQMALSLPRRAAFRGGEPDV